MTTHKDKVRRYLKEVANQLYPLEEALEAIDKLYEERFKQSFPTELINPKQMDIIRKRWDNTRKEWDRGNLSCQESQ